MQAIHLHHVSLPAVVHLVSRSRTSHLLKTQALRWPVPYGSSFFQNKLLVLVKAIRSPIRYAVVGAIFTGWEEKTSCNDVRYAVFDDPGSYSGTKDVRYDAWHQHRRLFAPRGEKR
jgi:hypothetical protein